MKIFPKKSLAQNFLIDKNIIAKICEVSKLKKNDHVLEIGPGTGNLSKCIMQKNPEKFYVIEKDKRLTNYLKSRFENNIEIINGDILKYNLNRFSNNNLVIFGNLPYNISSQILIKIIHNFKNDFNFRKLVFMFQKEVADRILAEDHSRNYGRLSILSSWRLNIKKIIDIKPSSFNPVPKVMSSLLIFEPKLEFTRFKNSKNLEHITKVFFNQRRKMIKKPLNILFKNPTKVISQLSLNINLRPQNLNKEIYYKMCLIYEELTK